MFFITHELKLEREKENNVTWELNMFTFVYIHTYIHSSPEKWFIKLLLVLWLDGCWLDGTCQVCSVDSGSVNQMFWCSDAVVTLWKRLTQVLTQVLWRVRQFNALKPSVWQWFDAEADYNKKRTIITYFWILFNSLHGLKPEPVHPLTVREVWYDW